MKMSLKNAPSQWLILISLFCVTIVSGCQLPEQIAKAKLDKEQADKNAQAEQAKKKALDELESQSDKFAALAPPVKEVDQPYLKGKVIFVYKRADNKSEFLPEDRAALGELYANSVAEVKTVVQINCFNLRDGDYINERTNEKIPAFTVRCDVDVIDNTIPAVIVSKQFENKQLPEKTVFKKTDKEIVALSPYKEIQTFVRNLPRKP
ncbi:hypothetical protein [Pseudanabaena sp. 'Roaring Creek']|uniref:hypothetical protein n=1 Tax=Pseudanabaena sp. 'Roaring Creek' TaxID=1681830 RepID=UPI0006D7FFCF|nr:hypothetical protein [Pseudanabaena sp. 'Roaring Creek']